MKEERIEEKRKQSILFSSVSCMHETFFFPFPFFVSSFLLACEIVPRFQKNFCCLFVCNFCEIQGAFKACHIQPSSSSSWSTWCPFPPFFLLPLSFSRRVGRKRKEAGPIWCIFATSIKHSNTRRRGRRFSSSSSLSSFSRVVA